MKRAHKDMLKVIETEAKFTRSYTGRAAFSARVMEAMARVDRGAFVPEEYQAQAYDDGPLPIGYGQTISQPYIVALMTDLLELTPESVVLEIGTGSGYQAAILACLAARVYTVEKVAALAEAAQQRFQTLHYTNIETRCDNGYYGWQEKAPFDAIIVTAAAPHIPPSLVEQLKPGGRMVVPVGQPYADQTLMRVRKALDGTIHSDAVLGVAFVPLLIDEAPTHSE